MFVWLCYTHKTLITDCGCSSDTTAALEVEIDLVYCLAHSLNGDSHLSQSPRNAQGDNDAMWSKMIPNKSILNRSHHELEGEGTCY